MVTRTDQTLGLKLQTARTFYFAEVQPIVNRCHGDGLHIRSIGKEFDAQTILRLWAQSGILSVG